MSKASTAAEIDAGHLNTLTSVASNMYMISVVVPTVVSSGNQVFTRLQDLNHPSLVSLGGGARRANNYLTDGVSRTDLVNRPSVNPSFEAAPLPTTKASAPSIPLRGSGIRGVSMAGCPS
jgi:hypothetical protein